MLDMHCHIIPETDDGAKDMNITLKMGKKASQLGYDCILATSHYIIPNNQLENKEYLERIRKVNKEFEKNDINVTVYPGNEIFFTNDILGLITSKKVCTLANSRYVLIELPLYTRVVPFNVFEEFNKLQDAGYVPVLAHPERYDFVTESISNIYQLIESGVLMQVNIASITGKYGSNAKRNVIKMLKHNMVHFFGTDAHSASVYSDYKRAMKKIKANIKSEEIYNNIMYGNPSMLLKDLPIPIIYPDM